jgi:glucokinase
MSLFPYPCLLADVGGTNARFALVETPGGPISSMLRLESGAEADFAVTVRRALETGGFPAPRSFLLAVAGPVQDRRAVLTNAATSRGALVIDGPVLAEQLGLDQGLLFNDFEALCLALPFLEPAGLMLLGAGEAVSGGPMVVVGPGTGLGVGALLRHGAVWLPVASEGGHVGLGPESAEDRALWPHLGDGMISGEDILSGRGLTRLYRGIARMRSCPGLDHSPAAITERARAGEDRLAVQTMERFLRLLARFAGDTALMLGATGGIFIGGGIAPRFRDWPLLTSGDFAAVVRDRGRASGYLADIPIQLITAPDAALQGLAAVAGNASGFALNFDQRCWR